ncbi:hypothetical protein [Rikenella microfusus]|uniref:Uncharacterized protein n=1 Tax=Rikenella microfusus TaxID=28139 RepID=A0A379MR66_9BACT|nr:hypothetical protein [Rikenella microfusus]SUE34141.1 Uncharacterised protein [Rikenella microfusus]
MKKLMIVSAVSLLAACSAVDKSDLEIRQKPTLTLGYAYLNDAGENTTAQEIR